MHRSFTVGIISGIIPGVACLILATALGCAADNGDEGIFITKNVVPGAGCTFTATESELFLGHGTYSIHSPASYRLHPQMKSRVTATAAQEQARTVILQGARVELDIPDTSVLSVAQQDDLRRRGVMRFTSLFTAPLPPNGGVTDGEHDLISPALLDELVAAQGSGILAADAPPFRTEVVATVVVYGDMSGNEVTSQEFQFPVTICNDCVTNELGMCPLPVDTVLRTGNACNPYQDGVVDCCRQGADVVCPALVLTM